MALDRLIAEAMLLIGSIYLGYALFIVLGHMGLALSLMNSINQMAGTSVYIPDAVIVTNGSINQLYLVIYNDGHTSINLKNIYMNCQGNTIEVKMNNTYLAPENYIIINRQIPYQQCRLVPYSALQIPQYAWCTKQTLRSTSFHELLTISDLNINLRLTY
ncbi:hypothetical protein [Vulcanisaeta sp. JCM 16159]|uniref:hypothetical protein n=1 Tax=Vulcanisaeta sp. JCM 16159 TaxID=1295371 RepID=UPI0006D05575|nr:hypothetical protein [Vulcanisaeta sp. JCM 16159]